MATYHVSHPISDTFVLSLNMTEQDVKDLQEATMSIHGESVVAVFKEGLNAVSVYLRGPAEELDQLRHRIKAACTCIGRERDFPVEQHPSRCPMRLLTGYLKPPLVAAPTEPAAVSSMADVSTGVPRIAVSPIGLCADRSKLLAPCVRLAGHPPPHVDESGQRW